jgi:glucans biosynthesis protein C
MDWLRIGAFACLILYHVGMVFVPWGFHVKERPSVDWMTIPMLAVSPWRLTLLFVVSGYASRALLRRWRGPATFAWRRSVRLLVPLAFAVVVVVPPQPWVELVTQHGYARSFGHFWLHDFFRFGHVAGIGLPAWNHLWFVGYLWTYTVALALLTALPRPPQLQRWFDRLFGGMGAVLLPLGWLLATQVIVFQRWTDSQDVIHDGVAHLAYFPAFLFGFALARSDRVMAAIVRWHRPAGIAALAAWGVAVARELVWPGGATPPARFVDLLVWSRQVHCWGAIVALIGFAEVHLNRDHRWRATLTEAVFPFYIIHQTAIVLAFYLLVPLALPTGLEFLALVTATVAACWLFYLGGREIPWARPLIGLRPRLPRSREPAIASVPTL